jgi:hypothetical protein
MEKEKKLKKCCLSNIDKPIKKGRATWLCRKCGKDISLMYVFIQKQLATLLTCMEKKKKTCKHSAGKGYWSNRKGAVCLKCGAEINT